MDTAGTQRLRVGPGKAERMKQQTANTFPVAITRKFSPHISPTASWIIFLLALFMGAVLIIYQSNHTPTYPIDSYFYMSKAKQFVSGHGLTTSWNDGADPKYFPGYSLILAVSFALGGSYVPVQFFAYLLSAVLLIFLLKELHVEDTTQALAASAFAANPIVIKWYSLPMAEGTALTLSLAALFLFLRFMKTRQYALLVVSCLIGGFAVVTRMEAAFLVFLFIVFVYRDRHSVNPVVGITGAALFFLPLSIYWAIIRNATGGGPAYLGEFASSVGAAGFLKNIIYNIWAPFGLMQAGPFRGSGMTLLQRVVSRFAGATWLLTGELIFLAGLLLGIGKRSGPKVRTAAFLFLGYACIHALWYYRYERFLLLVLPISAFIWASCLFELANTLQGKTGRRTLSTVNVMLVLSGLVLGNVFSSFHADLLQKETGNLQFPAIARALNKMNGEKKQAFLTDLGPHLAFYLDAHSFMDNYHGNYWDRAFPPDDTMEALEQFGIGLIVTRQDMGQWMAQHKISREKSAHFEEATPAIEGVHVIRYRSSLSDS
jgi:hypothetical protein